MAMRSESLTGTSIGRPRSGPNVGVRMCGLHYCQARRDCAGKPAGGKASPHLSHTRVRAGRSIFRIHELTLPLPTQLLVADGWQGRRVCFSILYLGRLQLHGQEASVLLEQDVGSRAVSEHQRPLPHLPRPLRNERLGRITLHTQVWAILRQVRRPFLSQVTACGAFHDVAADPADQFGDSRLHAHLDFVRLGSMAL